MAGRQKILQLIEQLLIARTKEYMQAFSRRPRILRTPDNFGRTLSSRVPSMPTYFVGNQHHVLLPIILGKDQILRIF